MSVSHAKRDGVDGISWDFGVRLLPTDPEDHKGVGRNGGGGVDAFTQPALGSTLVEFHCYLHREGRNGTCRRGGGGGGQETCD